MIGTEVSTWLWAAPALTVSLLEIVSLARGVLDAALGQSEACSLLTQHSFPAASIRNEGFLVWG